MGLRQRGAPIAGRIERRVRLVARKAATWMTRPGATAARAQHRAQCRGVTRDQSQARVRRHRRRRRRTGREHHEGHEQPKEEPQAAARKRAGEQTARATCRIPSVLSQSPLHRRPHARLPPPTRADRAGQHAPLPPPSNLKFHPFEPDRGKTRPPTCWTPPHRRPPGPAPPHPSPHVCALPGSPVTTQVRWGLARLR
jgi:hypothetical protein